MGNVLFSGGYEGVVGNFHFLIVQSSLGKSIAELRAERLERGQAALLGSERVGNQLGRKAEKSKLPVAD